MIGCSGLYHPGRSIVAFRGVSLPSNMGLEPLKSQDYSLVHSPSLCYKNLLVWLHGSIRDLRDTNINSFLLYTRPPPPRPSTNTNAYVSHAVTGQQVHFFIKNQPWEHWGRKAWNTQTPKSEEWMRAYLWRILRSSVWLWYVCLSPIASQIFMGALSHQMILNINITIVQIESTDENKLLTLGWERITIFRPPGCHLVRSWCFFKNEHCFLFWN